MFLKNARYGPILILLYLAYPYRPCEVEKSCESDFFT